MSESGDDKSRFFDFPKNETEQQITQEITIEAKPTKKRRIDFGEEDEMIRILKKPYRTAQEIMMLEEKTKELKFFEQINKVTANQKAHLHRRICKYLTLEFIPKGRVVFYEGQEANNFYILLKGKSCVLIKKNLQKRNSQSMNDQAKGDTRKIFGPRKSIQMISSSSNTPLMKMLRIRFFHKIVWRIINVLRFFKIGQAYKKRIMQKEVVPTSPSKKQQAKTPKMSRLSKQFSIVGRLQANQEKVPSSNTKIPPQGANIPPSSTNIQNQSSDEPPSSASIPQQPVHEHDLPLQSQNNHIQFNSSLTQNQILISTTLIAAVSSAISQPLIPVQMTSQRNMNNSQFYIQHQNSTHSIHLNSQQQQKQSHQEDIQTSQINQIVGNNSQVQATTITQQSQKQSQSHIQLPLQVAQMQQAQVAANTSSQIQIPTQLTLSQIPPIILSQGKISSVMCYGAFGIKTFGNDKFQKLRKEIQVNILPELDIMYLENINRFFDRHHQCFQYNVTKVFQKGDSFGELALLNRKPRSATILCLQDCYFASLTKQHYAETLREVEKQQIQKKIEFLQQAILPRSIVVQENQEQKQKTLQVYQSSRSKLNRMQVSFTKSKFILGHIIQKQGKPINKVYIIKKGEVNCSIKTTHTEMEKQIEIQLAIFEKFECIGAEEVILLLEEIETATKMKERERQEKIDRGEDISEDEIIPQELIQPEAETVADNTNKKRNKKDKQTKFVMSDKIAPVAYSTASIKSQTCSLLEVLVSDFCRFLEEFPEMKSHLTMVAKSKRIWIDKRKKEQQKLLQNLMKEKFNNPLTINDSSLSPLLSPSSLFHRALQLKITTKDSKSKEKKQVMKKSKNKSIKIKQNEQQHIFSPKIISSDKPMNNISTKSSQLAQDSNEKLQELVEDYFQKQVSNVNTWGGGALTYMSDQKVKLTKEVIAQQQWIIEEGLALKYGYQHNLSNQKISTGQVVDFIFNHEETKNQMAIAETAVASKMTYCGVVSELEKGAIKLKERNDQVKQKEVVQVAKPVRVDYTTLGYSDELIKRMKKRQAQLLKEQQQKEKLEEEKRINEQKAAEAEQAEQSKKEEEQAINNAMNMNEKVSALRIKSPTLSFSQKIKMPNSLQRLFAPLSKIIDTPLPTTHIIKRRHRMTDSNGNLIKKKINIPLDPDEVKKNIKLNKKILKNTQELQIQRARTLYNPAIYSSQSYGMPNPSYSSQRHPTLRNSRFSKKIYEKIFSKSIFAPPPPPPEQPQQQQPQHFSHSNSSPSPLRKHFLSHAQSLRRINTSLTPKNRNKQNHSFTLSQRKYNESPSQSPSLRRIYSQQFIRYQETNSVDPSSSIESQSFEINQMSKERSYEKNSISPKLSPNVQQQLSAEFEKATQQYQSKHLKKSHSFNQSDTQFKQDQISTIVISNQKSPNHRTKSQQITNRFTEEGVQSNFSKSVQTSKLQSPRNKIVLNLSQKNDKASSSQDKATELERDYVPPVSHFKRTEDHQNNQLKIIINKFQSQAYLPNEYFEATKHFNKEINIHLNKKNNSKKSILWHSHRSFKSTQEQQRESCQQQEPPQDEEIFQRVNSIKEISLPASKPSTSHSDFFTIPHILQSIQSPSSSASLQFLEQAEKSRAAQDKLVMLNHMGKPVQYFFAPSKSRSSHIPVQPASFSATSIGASFGASTLFSQRKGTSKPNASTHGRPKQTNYPLRTSQSSRTPSTPQTLIMTGKDFFPKKGGDD